MTYEINVKNEKGITENLMAMIDADMATGIIKGLRRCGLIDDENCRNFEIVARLDWKDIQIMDKYGVEKFKCFDPAFSISLIDSWCGVEFSVDGKDDDHHKCGDLEPLDAFMLYELIDEAKSASSK